MKEEEKNRVQRRTEEQMQRENEKHGIRSPLTAAVLDTRSGRNAYSCGEDVAGGSCKTSTMLDRYRWRTYMHGPTQVRLTSSCSGNCSGNCTGVANCELVDNKIRITYCTSTTGLGFVHIITIIIGSLLTSKSLFNSPLFDKKNRSTCSFKMRTQCTGTSGLCLCAHIIIGSQLTAMVLTSSSDVWTEYQCSKVNNQLTTIRPGWKKYPQQSTKIQCLRTTEVTQITLIKREDCRTC